MRLLLIYSLIIFFSDPGVSQSNDHLELKLFCSFNSKVPGSRLPMKFELRNNGSDSLKVVYPTINGRSIRVSLFKESTELRMAIEWLGSPASKAILPPMDSFSHDFDLRDYYGYFLEPGNYSCQISYCNMNDTSLVSEIIHFQLLPLSDYESESRAQVKKIIYFYEEGFVRLGKEYLKKYDRSIFSNRIRKKLAYTLNSLNRFDESLYYYEKLYNSDELTNTEKRHAILCAAKIWLRKGERDKAIQTLKLDESFSYKYNNPNWGLAKNTKWGSLEDKLKARQEQKEKRR